MRLLTRRTDSTTGGLPEGLLTSRETFETKTVGILNLCQEKRTCNCFVPRKIDYNWLSCAPDRRISARGGWPNDDIHWDEPALNECNNKDKICDCFEPNEVLMSYKSCHAWKVKPAVKSLREESPSELEDQASHPTVQDKPESVADSPSSSVKARSEQDHAVEDEFPPPWPPQKCLLGDVRCGQGGGALSTHPEGAADKEVTTYPEGAGHETPTHPEGAADKEVATHPEGAADKEMATAAEPKERGKDKDDEDDKWCSPFLGFPLFGLCGIDPWSGWELFDLDW